MRDHQVTAAAELDALYGPASETSILKEIDHISDDYAAFIAASPFVVLASVGPGGLDCTPRGDPAGFVRVADRKTLLLPDRRGNNRLDTLRNLIDDPRLSLLFLIPGIGETLRINGRATISTDPALCAGFIMDGKPPQTVLIVAVERVYFHCPKALMRSRLWDPAVQISRSALPSPGRILQNIRAEVDGAVIDAGFAQRMRDTMY